MSWNWNQSETHTLLKQCQLVGKGPVEKDCAHWVYRHEDGRVFAFLVGIDREWGADHTGFLEITEAEITQYI